MFSLSAAASIVADCPGDALTRTVFLYVESDGRVDIAYQMDTRVGLNRARRSFVHSFFLETAYRALLTFVCPCRRRRTMGWFSSKKCACGRSNCCRIAPDT